MRASGFWWARRVRLCSWLYLWATPQLRCHLQDRSNRRFPKLQRTFLGIRGSLQSLRWRTLPDVQQVKSVTQFPLQPAQLFPSRQAGVVLLHRLGLVVLQPNSNKEKKRSWPDIPAGLSQTKNVYSMHWRQKVMQQWNGNCCQYRKTPPSPTQSALERTANM